MFVYGTHARISIENVNTIESIMDWFWLCDVLIALQCALLVRARAHIRPKIGKCIFIIFFYILLHIGVTLCLTVCVFSSSSFLNLHLLQIYLIVDFISLPLCCWWCCAIKVAWEIGKMEERGTRRFAVCVSVWDYVVVAGSLAPMQMSAFTRPQHAAHMTHKTWRCHHGSAPLGQIHTEIIVRVESGLTTPCTRSLTPDRQQAHRLAHTTRSLLAFLCRSQISLFWHLYLWHSGAWRLCACQMCKSHVIKNVQKAATASATTIETKKKSRKRKMTKRRSS